MNPIVNEVDGRLARGGATDDNLLEILKHVLAHFDCQVGTIHRWDAATGLLQLRAQRGLPDAILDKVTAIPIGKGMAGIAAERREPVQVCNLQTDASGVVRPNAKMTKMEGSIAVPMLVAGALRGTLGVAKSTTYTFTDDENAALLAIASKIGQHFS
ncbi:MAG: GAF domain-containing protein [Planctomycetes bacterium]|nr:GAF domain-containing protein [Planctomycetota bacterium]MBI3847606.1 GAF domain-containing protein [Planctomycetota bacterium]